MLHEPCSRCGRTLLELRGDATRESMRGTAPLCSVPRCPLVQRVLGFAERPRALGTELQGPSPPAVFVGRHGYPAVQMGPLLPPIPELAASGLSDSPADWARDLDIADILAMRSRLVRSKSLVRVDAAAQSATGALEASRALAMASKPLETEVTLAKPPRLTFEPKLDAFAAPMGPSVNVVDARVLSNPSVPRKVDAVVSDVHADAATGTMEMYEGGISPYHIQRLLSVGLLGRASRRKLVPTRWSITATDDILGLRLIEDVKEQTVLDKPEVYASSLFGNHFHVMLLPRAWAFEMLEAWNEEGEWRMGHDVEPYQGRTSYADSVTGAYYAARLSVLEHLLARRVQAAALVHREITEEYWAPLGVWVIREAVKTALAGKGLPFEDVESAVRHVHRRSRAKDWVKVAVLPREARVQRTLKDFLGGSG